MRSGAEYDEIVEFAGVERFIETPLKRYSSGMQLRLAFAVAAHLEPELMLVDEILAVGDIEFQRRCLERMDRLSAEGRTVIFVSHDLGAVTRLCSRAIWADSGRLVGDGEPDRGRRRRTTRALLGQAGEAEFAVNEDVGVSHVAILDERGESARPAGARRAPHPADPARRRNGRSPFIDLGLYLLNGDGSVVAQRELVRPVGHPRPRSRGRRVRDPADGTPRSARRRIRPRSLARQRARQLLRPPRADVLATPSGRPQG